MAPNIFVGRILGAGRLHVPLIEFSFSIWGHDGRKDFFQGWPKGFFRGG